jgi:hypothetical protein
MDAIAQAIGMFFEWLATLVFGENEERPSETASVESSPPRDSDDDIA